MFEAGSVDKYLSSTAYLNWDCNSGNEDGTLCMLVKATDGVYLLDEFWFKNYDVTNSVLNPIGGNVTTIYDSTSTNITAWEACYTMNAQPVACKTKVEIHANWDCIGATSTQSRTSSTGKGNNIGFIALDLSCPFTT